MKQKADSKKLSEAISAGVIGNYAHKTIALKCLVEKIRAIPGPVTNATFRSLLCKMSLTWP